MFAIKSSNGFWNTSYSCWEDRLTEATWYSNRDFADVIREIVSLDYDIRCELFEFCKQEVVDKP